MLMDASQGDRTMPRAGEASKISLLDWLRDRAGISKISLLDSLSFKLAAANVVEVDDLHDLSKLPIFDIICKHDTAAKIRSALNRQVHTAPRDVCHHG